MSATPAQRRQRAAAKRLLHLCTASGCRLEAWESSALCLLHLAQAAERQRAFKARHAAEGRCRSCKRRTKDYYCNAHKRGKA